MTHSQIANGPNSYQLQVNEAALVTHIDSERWLYRRWNIAQTQMQELIDSYSIAVDIFTPMLAPDLDDAAFLERFMFWSCELVDTWRAIRGKITA